MSGAWSDVESAVANNVMQRIDRALVLSVCIAKVKGKDDASFRGRFNPSTDVITVTLSQGLDELDGALHHEVCHAIDRTNLLVDQNRSVWEGSRRSHGWMADKEFFAEVCASIPQPEALGWLHPTQCDGDGLYAPQFEALANDVFSAPGTAVRSDILFSEPMAVELSPDGPEAPEQLLTSCMPDGTVLLSSEKGWWQVRSDLSADFLEALPIEDFRAANVCAHEVGNPVGWSCDACSMATLSDGTLVGRRHLQTRTYAGTEDRWVAWDGTVFETLPFCPSGDDEAAVMLGGKPVLLEVVGGQLFVRYLTLQ